MVKDSGELKPVLYHAWDVSSREACRVQAELARRLVVENGFREISSVAGADAAFGAEKAYAALVVCSYPGLEKLEEVVVEGKVGLAYVPGLLSFREGPVLLKAFEKVKMEPDLVLFDGQGIAHPRRLGLASHMGILLEKPTIGCAKSRFLGEHGEVGLRKGSMAPLTFRRETVGWVLRTRDGVKPVFVSPGHLVDLETAVSIVLSCSRRYRIPEPLREADLLSRRRKSLRRSGGYGFGEP